MYDLEERTMDFAVNMRHFIQKIPEGIIRVDDLRQVIRSSGSIGANYIEANEALSKKDFLNRMKISRKEAKETTFWLTVIIKSYSLNDGIKSEGIKLLTEAEELRKILSAIILKCQR
jgi:four helix bundle protein